MRERYLSEKCRKCDYNHESLAMCFDICGVPEDLLEEIEKSNKEYEEFRSNCGWSDDEARWSY